MAMDPKSTTERATDPLPQPRNDGADYSATPRPAAPLNIVVPANRGGERLDQLLADLLPAHSRSRLARWIKQGDVLVDGVRAEPSRKVRGGEVLSVAVGTLPEESAFAPEAIALDIVYEDDCLLVIDKPAGLVVHPGSGNWHGTMLNALLHHASELKALPRAGIVHRLDKDTSGLLVVAKTLATHTDLVRQLQARSVTREYFCVVHGVAPRDGRVEAPLARDPRTRTKMAVVRGGKPAVTHFQVIERFARHSLIGCRLETGRTHQIRVHMQSIGFPLVGDKVYGPKRGEAKLAASAAAAFPRQALHARRLALTHPRTGRSLAWEAPVPADLRTLIDALRAGT
jgi:23S rRNA pseudouridine1911/1915/1917 synthase